MRKKKICINIFFQNFPVAGTKGKLKKKKKNLVLKLDGLLPKVCFDQGARQALGWARSRSRDERGRGVRGAGVRGGRRRARQAGADARGTRLGRAACARRLGQVGALCTWLSSDSVFDPVLTQYCS